MSPRQIVKTLKEKHIALAALTDHNVALNCPAFAACCKEAGIAALYGMEAQTAEEIHVLCLFPELQTALDFCASWYETLPNVMNKPEVTGDQVYVNERDEIIGEVEKYLITSAPYTLDECAELVHKAGGLVIPAHVDRPAFSMMSQLGAIVAGDWDALEFVRPHVLQERARQSENCGKESGRTSMQRVQGSARITNHIDVENVRQAIAALPIVLPAPYAITTSSDAHYVEHIGRRAFELDIGDEPLVTESGIVNLAAVRAGLERRVVHP